MNNTKMESMTVEVKTPDGTLYYTICEDDNLPVKVITTISKSGSPLSAWAYAVDVLVNMLFEKGSTINDIIDGLSLISSHRPMITMSGVKVGSGPEGIVVALMEYKRQKYKEMIG